MNINPDIKVFFVYEELSTPLEDSDESDIIYNDIAIQPNSILNKTLRAIYAINKYYSYDYFIRTNISTFWDLNRINLLLDQCPKTACYAGGHDLSPFNIYIKNIYVNKINTPLYSGICIIFTPDIVKNILDNIHKLRFYLPDDIAIGVYMSDIKCNTMTYTSRAYYEKYGPTDDTKIISEITSAIQNNYTYYRVKNENNREHTDSMIYNHLLKYVYNI
jgi:hypothetical protein